MDIGRALRAPARDPKALGKLAIAFLLTVVPFAAFAVLGWGIAYVRSVAEGRDSELPEWNDFGNYWVRGLAFAFAMFVFYLPVVLILVIFGVPGFLVAGAGGDPLSALSTLLGSLLIGIVVAAFFGLVASFLLQAARVNYAVKGTFGAAFDLKEILGRVKANFGAYITAWLMEIVLVVVAQVVAFGIAVALSWLPFSFVVTLPLSFGLGLYLGMCINALYGQYGAVAYGMGMSSGHPVAGAGGYPASGQAAFGGPTAPFAPVAAGSGMPSGANVTSESATFPPSPATGPRPAPSGLTGQAAVAAAMSRLNTTSPPATPQEAPAVVAPERAREVDSEDSQKTVELSTAQSEMVAEPEPGVTEREPAPELVATEPVLEQTPDPAPEPTREPEAAPAVQAVQESAPQPDLARQPMPQPIAEPERESAPELVPEPVPMPELAQEQIPEMPDEPEPELEPAPVLEAEPVPAAPQPMPVETAVSESPPAEVVSEQSSPLGVQFELVRNGGPGTPGETWVLPKADVRIGRSSACFVSVSDGKVSRAHAVLAVGPDAVEVRDLDSGNGTFINEAKADAPVALQVGDRLRVGDTLFELRLANR